MSDDLIRRSDAIKQVKWWFDLIELNPDILIDGIISLPTIEPTEEFEWCHDCKEYDQDKHCCHRWSKQIRKTVAELEEHYKPKRGEWIVYEGEWKDFDYYPPKCTCNQCGYEEDLYILNAKPTDFCPNCGADMRKGADDETDRR